MEYRFLPPEVAREGLGAVLMTGWQVKTGPTWPEGEMRIFGHYAVVFLVSGAGRYADLNGVDRVVEPGDLIFVFPTLGHRYGPAEGGRWEELYLVFNGPVVDRWRRSGWLDPGRPVVNLRPVAAWRERMAVVAEPEHAGAAGRLREMCRLQLLLAEALTNPSAEDALMVAWATRAIELMAREPRMDSDLAAVATRLHLSYSAFRRRFRQEVGVSPGRYRQRLVIERARQMMHEGAMTDKQIALALGFCDAHHFSSRFKAVMGVGPRAYRRTRP